MRTERRAVARYRARIAVQVDIDEYEFDAIAMEISLLGLSVVCEGSVANQVLSRYIKVTPGENLAAGMQIKIPQAPGLVKTIKCETRVIAVNRISQSSYVVGFKLEEFNADGKALWVDYIGVKY